MKKLLFIAIIIISVLIFAGCCNKSQPTTMEKLNMITEDTVLVIKKDFNLLGNPTLTLKYKDKKMRFVVDEGFYNSVDIGDPIILPVIKYKVVIKQ